MDKTFKKWNQGILQQCSSEVNRTSDLLLIQILKEN